MIGKSRLRENETALLERDMRRRVEGLNRQAQSYAWAILGVEYLGMANSELRAVNLMPARLCSDMVRRAYAYLRVAESCLLMAHALRK